MTTIYWPVHEWPKGTSGARGPGRGSRSSVWELDSSPSIHPCLLFAGFALALRHFLDSLLLANRELNSNSEILMSGRSPQSSDSNIFSSPKCSINHDSWIWSFSVHIYDYINILTIQYSKSGDPSLQLQYINRQPGFPYAGQPHR